MNGLKADGEDGGGGISLLELFAPFKPLISQNVSGVAIFSPPPERKEPRLLSRTSSVVWRRERRHFCTGGARGA